MITKRLSILLAVFLAGFSAVYLLPHQLGYQPIGLKLQLPAELGPWQGKAMEITTREREALGAETQIERTVYTREGAATIQVSIVVAGQDMMSGLHRPERCLLAQGWNPGGSSRADLALPNFGALPATRLRNSRRVQLQPGAPFVPLENVCYYWFIGAHSLVATHERRLQVDMFDRLVHGYNQRWAMALVSGDITDHLLRNGQSEAQVDEAARDVISRLIPQVVKDGVR